jgi:hypothetical protein
MKEVKSRLENRIYLKMLSSVIIVKRRWLIL